MFVPIRDLHSSLDMNFEIFNLSIEPEENVKMGSCLRAVYRVLNDVSDGVLIVRIPLQKKTQKKTQ